jgi:hypothetical protein
MSANAAQKVTPMDFEDHIDERGDITSVMRPKSTVRAMDTQQPRTDNVAQLQSLRVSKRA